MNNVTSTKYSYVDSDIAIFFIAPIKENIMPTKNNRIIIPMDIVREMGWVPGDLLEYTEFYVTETGIPLEYTKFEVSETSCFARRIRIKVCPSKYYKPRHLMVNTDGRVRMTVPYNVMRVSIHKKNDKELQLTLFKK